jgi:hypothetical protein
MNKALIDIILELPLWHFQEILLHIPSLEFGLSDAIINILNILIFTKIANFAN